MLFYKNKPATVDSETANRSSVDSSTSKQTSYFSSYKTAPSTNSNIFYTPRTSMSHNTGYLNNSNQPKDLEDEQLVHAMARQYVLDAEAVGSAAPSPAIPNHSESSLSSFAPSEKEKQPATGTKRPNSSTSAPSDLMMDGYTPGQAWNIQRETSDDEDDANMARHFVPTRMRYPAPKYKIQTDSSVPAGAVLFLLGFLVLPLWWIGAVFPRSSKSREEVTRTWRKYNALMTLLSLPLLGLFLALGGWEATHN